MKARQINEKNIKKGKKIGKSEQNCKLSRNTAVYAVIGMVFLLVLSFSACNDKGKTEAIADSEAKNVLKEALSNEGVFSNYAYKTSLCYRSGGVATYETSAEVTVGGVAGSADGVVLLSSSAVQRAVDYENTVKTERFFGKTPDGRFVRGTKGTSVTVEGDWVNNDFDTNDLVVYENEDDFVEATAGIGLKKELKTYLDVLNLDDKVLDLNEDSRLSGQSDAVEYEISGTKTTKRKAVLYSVVVNAVRSEADEDEGIVTKIETEYVFHIKYGKIVEYSVKEVYSDYGFDDVDGEVLNTFEIESRAKIEYGIENISIPSDYEKYGK